MKYSISICSNSRVRKMKLPGVISLRNALPICPIPNGGFLRAAVTTLRKFTKMPWAVSGRRKCLPSSLSTGPRKVFIRPENCCGSVHLPSWPVSGSLTSARPLTGGWPCLAS